MLKWKQSEGSMHYSIRYPQPAMIAIARHVKLPSFGSKLSISRSRQSRRATNSFGKAIREALEAQVRNEQIAANFCTKPFDKSLASDDTHNITLSSLSEEHNHASSHEQLAYLRSRFVEMKRTTSEQQDRQAVKRTWLSLRQSSPMSARRIEREVTGEDLRRCCREL